MDEIIVKFREPMTVRQLREELAKLPPEADELPVWSEGCDCTEKAHGFQLDKDGLEVCRKR